MKTKKGEEKKRTCSGYKYRVQWKCYARKQIPKVEALDPNLEKEFNICNK